MAMSKRSGGEKQEDIWIAHTELAVDTELAVAPGHACCEPESWWNPKTPGKNNAPTADSSNRRKGPLGRRRVSSTF
jgi:hypothetical protein